MVDQKPAAAKAEWSVVARNQNWAPFFNGATVLRLGAEASIVWDAGKLGPGPAQPLWLCAGATVLRWGAEESVVWDAGKIGPRTKWPMKRATLSAATLLKC